MTPEEKRKWTYALFVFCRGEVVKGYDKKGFEKKKRQTYVDIAERCSVSRMTAWRWVKTGSIAPYYRRLLIEKKIVDKKDLL